MELLVYEVKMSHCCKKSHYLSDLKCIFLHFPLPLYKNAEFLISEQPCCTNIFERFNVNMHIACM